MLEKYNSKALETGESINAPELGGKVAPGGGKIGGKKYCRFKIEREDSIILISDNVRYSGSWPNVKIEISGERCLVYPGGALAAQKSAIMFLENMGAAIHVENVSRVDFCADFPGSSMARFDYFYRRRRWTCRSKRHHPDVSNGLSLYFGSNPLQLRIYDKLAEMKAKALQGAPAKYEHMIQKRWGGTEPESAVRVEYQCNREWLKTYGVTDVNSLLRLARDLLGYLTGAGENKWFRFLTRKNHKHFELNETMLEWCMVQDTFLQEFARPEPLITIDPDKANVETLLKQALGVLETAACNRGYAIPGKESTAPEKYRFENYEDFAQWINTQLRFVAVNKGVWKFRKKPTWDEFDEELEIIHQRRERQLAV